MRFIYIYSPWIKHKSIAGFRWKYRTNIVFVSSITHDEVESDLSETNDVEITVTKTNLGMHFVNFFVFCVVFTPRWKDSLIFVLFFFYFSSIKCFLLCDLSKNFKVHCNAFEKSLGHLTLPHGKITWFETTDTCTKMFVVCYPYSVTFAQNRYRCSMSHK